MNLKFNTMEAWISTVSATASWKVSIAGYTLYIWFQIQWTFVESVQLACAEQARAALITGPEGLSSAQSYMIWLGIVSSWHKYCNYILYQRISSWLCYIVSVLIFYIRGSVHGFIVFELIFYIRRISSWVYYTVCIISVD